MCSNTKKPLVYIIIINWNGYKDTIECIKSFKKISYKNYKIIVVDNGSANREASKIKNRFPEVTIVKNKENLGFSKANNQGMKLAVKGGADFILLLNNDTAVEKNFLSKLIAYTIKQKFKGILSPKILYYNTNIVWTMGGSLSVFTSIPRMIGQGKPSSDFNKVIKPDFVTGCALLINRSVVKKIGMLDEKYFAYYEDTDWSYRAKKANYDIRTIPNSIVWHKISKSTANKNSYKMGVTQSYLIARNGIIFGLENLTKSRKIFYLCSQYLLKYPLYLLLKVDSLKSAMAYSGGLIEGTKFILNKRIKYEIASKYIKQN